MLEKVSSDNRVLNELWDLDSDYNKAETIVVTNFNAARSIVNESVENLKLYETTTRKNIFTFFLDSNDAQAIKRDVESEMGLLLKKILDGISDLKDVHICTNDKNQTIRILRMGDIKLVKTVLRNDLDYSYVLKDDYSRIFGSVTDKVYKTLFGQEVVKINKFAVKDLDIEKFENDISQDYRYSLLMANDIRPHENYRVMVIDIETHGSVDIINVPKPMISATIHDNWTDKYYLYLFKPELEANIKFEKEGDYHLYYNSEKEMLTDIVKQIKETDVLSGWNINSFDILYLLRRYEKLGGKMIDVSLANKVRWNIREDKDRFEEKNFKVYGMDILDALVLTKDITKFNLKKPENMTLSTVGEFYLGTGKKKIEITSPSELWVSKQYDKLLEYNKNDVVLVVNIAKQLRLFEYYSNIKKIVPSVNISEAQHNSVIIDKLLLTKFNHVIYPSKHWEEKIKVEGAYVSEPIPGIYNEVGVFDFSALYPNLIKSLNISPETIDPEGEVTVDDVRFTIKFKGILPQLVDYLMAERDRYKKMMKKFPKNSPDYVIYDMIQTSFKAIVNSVYGVFLLPSFRLYSADIGKSITSAGRKTIQAAWKYVEENEKDFKPIYGDTDSLFVCHLHHYRENCFEEFLQLEVRINAQQEKHLLMNFCAFMDNKIKMECESHFKKLILSDAKKKYLGLAKMYKGVEYDEPTLAFRGFVLIRRDAPQAIKVILQELVMILLKGTDKETIDAIKVAKDKLKLVPWTDLLVHKQINREIQDYKVIPQHVRAMQYANKYLKTNFSKQNYAGGMLFIRKCPPGFPATDVLAVDDSIQELKGFEIDYEKYFELYIKSPINLILSGQGERLFERNSLRNWITKNAAS